MPTDHAILAPSAAKRWLTCTPSARLEAKMPDRETSYAKEGTLAHSMAELILRIHINEDAKAYRTNFAETYKVAYTACEDGWQMTALYNALMEPVRQATEAGLDPWEMMETVSSRYCQLVYEDYLAAKREDPETLLLVESKLNLSHFIPEGFGSSDAVIVSDGTLRVYDLKFGKGVRVSAVNNPQMMIYAIGALWGRAELYDIDKVVMTIIQPRLDFVSTFDMDAEALLDWGLEILRPTASVAFRGEGELVSGDHCRFCRAAPTCPALRSMAEGTMKMGSSPELMSGEDFASVLGKLPAIKAWVSSVETYALDSMLAGNDIPGYKVVEGRSLRSIPDTAAAVQALKDKGFDPEDFYRPRELKTITDLEKQLKKKGFNEILGPFVVKPKGKPAIAPDDDPRPPYNNAEEDFKDVE